MSYILVRYLHFFALIGLAGALVIENMAIKPVISGEDARNLARVDAVYGLSAALVLVFGLVLWFGVGKPAEFYNANPVFHAKIGLFLLVGLMSVYPTVFFLRHRNSTADTISVPKPISLLLRLEIIILPVIPVLAFLMTRGIGLPS